MHVRAAVLQSQQGCSRQNGSRSWLLLLAFFMCGGRLLLEAVKAAWACREACITLHQRCSIDAQGLIAQLWCR